MEGNSKIVRLQFALLMLTTLSMPFAGFQLAQIGGYGIHIATVTAMCLIIVSLFFVILLGRITIALPAVAATGLLFATSVSAIGIVNAGFSLGQYLQFEIHLLFFVVFFIAVSNIKISTVLVKKLLRWIILEAIVLAVYGIYQLPARVYHLPFAWLPLNNVSFGAMRTTVFMGYPRVSSVFVEPNWFGLYIVDILLIVLFDALNRGTLFSKRIEWFLFIPILGLGWFLAFSGAAYFVLSVTLLLIALSKTIARLAAKRLTIKFENVKFAALLIVIALLAAVGASVNMKNLSVLPRAIENRVGGIIAYLTSGSSSYLISGESLPNRIQDFSDAVELWACHPWVGIGMSSYHAFYNQENFIDSLYPLFLAEGGLVGFIGLITFFVVILLYLAKKRSKCTNLDLFPIIDSYYWIMIAKFLEFFFNANFLSMGFWVPLSAGSLTINSLEEERNYAENTPADS